MRDTNCVCNGSLFVDDSAWHGLYAVKEAHVTGLLASQSFEVINSLDDAWRIDTGSIWNYYKRNHTTISSCSVVPDVHIFEKVL